MKAWLVVNAFLQQKKFQEIYQWLYEACKEKKIDIQMHTNQDLYMYIKNSRLELCEQVQEVAFVLFWDKDVILAKTLEALGFQIYNSAFSIEVCDNKSLTHLYLANKGIAMPDTIAAPMTYANIGYTNLEFVEEVVDALGLPLVVKESFGSFGQQVYLCHTKEEVIEQTKQLAGKSFLYQKYIVAAAGKDMRLQVVGNRVVAAMERTAKAGDFRANITNGGSMRMYTPSQEECAMAIAACKYLQASFAGVDLFYGEGKRPMVCEVNSNAHFKNIYDCTGVNCANAIVDYIYTCVEKNGRNR